MIKITNGFQQLDDFWGYLEDPKLPGKVIEKLEDKTGASTSCLQLLICKTSPFFWGLQDALKKPTHKRPNGLIKVIFLL